MSLDPNKEMIAITFDHDGAHMAMCHKLQGFGANGRPEALLIKSDDIELTDDVIADLDLIKSGVLPDDADTSSLSKGNLDVKDVDKGSHKPLENNPNPTTGELMATDQEKLDKAQTDLDTLMAKFETMEKSAADAATALTASNARIESFEKAAQERKEKAATKAAVSYSFVTEDEREDFAKALMALDAVEGGAEILLALDKAQAAINSHDGAQGADDDGSTMEKSSGVMDILMAKHGDDK